MQKNNRRNESDAYRVGKLTVLELMTVLAVLGIMVTWILRHFFAP